MAAAPPIDPFYFGRSGGRPLFGVYHAPDTRSRRDCSAVLCYPMGQEYIRSHRAYRELSVRLSRAGFPVLRFDFYGSGDSAGDHEEGCVRQWIEDVGTALGEIEHRTGRSKVCLIGLRFGAAVAMMAAAARGGVERMILWDPVIDGKAHLEELVALHDDQMERYFALGATRPSDHGRPSELLGFPITDVMLDDLRGIDLLTVSSRPADRALLLETGVRPIADRLRQRLEAIGTPTQCHHVTSPQVWVADMTQGKGLVPARALQSIVSWMS